MVFVLLFLIYFTQYDHPQVHPCFRKWHYFINFLWLSNILLSVCVCVYIYIYIHIYIYTCIYMHVYIIKIQNYFYILLHYGLLQALNIIPCAINRTLFSNLFNTQQFVFVNSKLLIYSSPTLPFVTKFSMFVSLFPFCK